MSAPASLNPISAAPFSTHRTEAKRAGAVRGRARVTPVAASMIQSRESALL